MEQAGSGVIGQCRNTQIPKHEGSSKFDASPDEGYAGLQREEGENPLSPPCIPPKFVLHGLSAKSKFLAVSARRYSAPVAPKAPSRARHTRSPGKRGEARTFTPGNRWLPPPAPVSTVRSPKRTSRRGPKHRRKNRHLDLAHPAVPKISPRKKIKTPLDSL